MNNNIFYIEGNFIDNSIKFIEKYPNAIVVAEDSLFKDVIEKKISQKIYLIDGLSVHQDLMEMVQNNSFCATSDFNNHQKYFIKQLFGIINFDEYVCGYI